MTTATYNNIKITDWQGKLTREQLVALAKKRYQQLSK